MNIRNYTSSVPVINSINFIEHRLASAGATHIAKFYEENRPVGMIFQITHNNVPLTFKLPAKSLAVYNVLFNAVKRPRPSTKETIRSQSDRTAWKILSDWVDIQITMIQLEQAEFTEVFLPYFYDLKTNKTLFEKVAANEIKLLI